MLMVPDGGGFESPMLAHMDSKLDAGSLEDCLAPLEALDFSTALASQTIRAKSAFTP